MRRLLWMFLALGCEPGVTAGDDEEARAALTRAMEAEDRCAAREAEPHYLTALRALEERQPGSLAHRRALRFLANLYLDVARPKDAARILTQAQALTTTTDEEAVKLAYSAASLSLYDERPAGAARAIANLGLVTDVGGRARVASVRSTIAEQTGRYDEARKYAEEALELRRAEGQPMAILWAMNRLAQTLLAGSDAAAAEKVLGDALGRLDSERDVPYNCEREKLDLILVHHLAVSYHDQSRHAEAAPLYRMVLDDEEARLGDHPDTAIELYSLALAHSADGELERAQPLLERALAMETATLSEDSPRSIPTLTALGRTVAELGDWPRAEALLTRAVAIWEAESGDRTIWGVDAHAELGHLRMLQGRNPEARWHLTRAKQLVPLMPYRAARIDQDLANVEP